MEKSISLAKQISKDPEKDWSDLIVENNFTSIFMPIHNITTSLKERNLIISFLIYSYDPESPRLIVNKDRYENKVSIMNGLGLNSTKQLMQEILLIENKDFIESSLLFLELLTDWRWPAIFTSLEYSSKMFRFVNQSTDEEKTFEKMAKDGVVKTISQDYDIDTIGKVNIQKSDLLKKAIEAREDAEKLLKSIKVDFMPTDHSTQIDLGFEFTETAKKKVNIESWKEFINNRSNSKIPT